MSTCSQCALPATLKCGDCDIVYCSNECGVQHWETHQYECIGGKRGRDDDTVITLILKESVEYRATVSQLEPFTTLSLLLEDTNDNVIRLPNISYYIFTLLLAPINFPTDRELAPIIYAANYLEHTKRLEEAMDILAHRLDQRLWNISKLAEEFGFKVSEYSEEELGESPLIPYIPKPEDKGTILEILTNLYERYVIPHLTNRDLVHLRMLHVRFWNLANRHILKSMREELPELSFATDGALIGIATQGWSLNAHINREYDFRDKYLLTQKDTTQLGALPAFRDIAILVVTRWGSFYNLKKELDRRKVLFDQHYEQLKNLLLERFGYIKIDALMRYYRMSNGVRIWETYRDALEEENLVISPNSQLVHHVIGAYKRFIRAKIREKDYNDLSSFLTNQAFARVISEAYL